MRIDMGVNVTDLLSGFTGTVTARCEYITGCDQYLVHPGGLDKEKGTPCEAKWFDDSRLKVNPNIETVVLIGAPLEYTRPESPGGPVDYPAPVK